jgi:hypothetical protein
MIYIFDNGEVYSNHTLYSVDAPEDFGAWFNDVYRPWLDGTEYRPLMIVATAPAVERRERVPYTPRPVDKFDLSIEDDPMHEFSTMSVVDFLAKIVVRERDGRPRPRYRVEIENVPENLDPRPEVALLLANIKAALPELERLRGDCRARADEDVPYRLLHLSNKVYWAQHHTTAIVTRLRTLAPVPGRLDDYIEEIIAAGTGKKWELSHNGDWTLHTRPIVEAYFWARYLLDMAIRFGHEYERPPGLLDYGWAALLTIYRLR